MRGSWRAKGVCPACLAASSGNDDTAGGGVGAAAGWGEEGAQEGEDMIWEGEEGEE